MKRLLFFISKPVLSVLAFVFRKKGNNDSVSVISFKLLGDSVFSIPAIKLISENYPDKTVVLFCYEDTKPVFQIALRNIEYVTFKRDAINFYSRVPDYKLIRKIRKVGSSTLFDLTCEYQSAVVSLFSGASQKIGFNTKYFENIFDVFSVKRKESDLTDMHMDPVLKFFNISPNENRKIFKKDFDYEGKIFIHPFAGWKAKEWGLNNFIRLADELNKEYVTKFIVPKGKLSNNSIQEIEGKNISIIETETVSELINELKNCSLIISNDSGPVYIAALLGKATFTLYGPTNPRYSLPRGSHHESVAENIECSPAKDNQYCLYYGGRLCQTFDCMARLSYSTVKNRLDSFLERINVLKINSVHADI